MKLLEKTFKKRVRKPGEITNNPYLTKAGYVDKPPEMSEDEYKENERISMNNMAERKKVGNIYLNYFLIP